MRASRTRANRARVSGLRTRRARASGAKARGASASRARGSKGEQGGERVRASKAKGEGKYFIKRVASKDFLFPRAIAPFTRNKVD